MEMVMKRIYGYLPQSKFVRGVGMLAGGTAFGQGIVVLCSPLLTRLYTPEEFGILAIYTSILSLLTVVASLRYELAIPLPEDDETAANLLVLSILVAVLFSAAVGGGCYLVGAGMFSVPQSYLSALPYLWLLPLGVITAGAYNALSYWHTRRKEYAALSYTRMLQCCAQVLVQTGAGYGRFGSAGLIVGFVVGRFFGVGTLWKKARLPQKCISAGLMVESLRAYRHFPLYNSASALINVLGTQAPPLLISSYFSMEATGQFSLTMRVLGLPAALVGQAVAQLYYPTAAGLAADADSARNFTENVATTLLVLCFPVFAFLVLFGPTLFVVIFGPKWASAGEYAQMLSPWLMFSFVSSPLSTFVLVKGKQKQTLFITIYETVLRIGALCVGGWLASLPLGIALYSGFGLLISVIYIGWVLRLSGSGIMRWLGTMRIYVPAAGCLLLLLLSAKAGLGPRPALWSGLGCSVLFACWSFQYLYRRRVCA